MALKSILSQSVGALISAGIIVTVPLSALGAVYVWDASNATPGPQDGSGTWSAGGTNWFDQTDSSQNQPWVDGNDAVIGAGSGAAGTITLGGNITVNSLTFNAAGSGTYTLTGSTLTNTTGVITAMSTRRSARSLPAQQA